MRIAVKEIIHHCICNLKYTSNIDVQEDFLSKKDKINLFIQCCNCIQPTAHFSRWISQNWNFKIKYFSVLNASSCNFFSNNFLKTGKMTIAWGIWRLLCIWLLKVVSDIFLFFFLPNDSVSKIMKNVFLFHLKSSFPPWDIDFFVIFSLPFYTFQIQKDK